MAIYRPPRPRWRLAVLAGLVGLIVGLVVGLVVGGRDPDPAEAARSIDATLALAAASLEVVGVEYDESVEDGEVVAEAEYEGARDALRSSRARFNEVRTALAVLDEQRVDEIVASYDDIADLIDERADSAEVRERLEALQSLLEG